MVADFLEGLLLSLPYLNVTSTVKSSDLSLLMHWLGFGGLFWFCFFFFFFFFFKFRDGLVFLFHTTFHIFSISKRSVKGLGQQDKPLGVGYLVHLTVWGCFRFLQCPALSMHSETQ